MFCQKCGNRIEDGDAFCGNCGRMVDASRITPVPAPDVPTDQITKKEKQPQGNALRKKRGTLIYAAVCLLIGSLALIATLVYVYSNSPDKRVEYRLTEGFEYLKEKDYKNAAKTLEEAVSLDPQNLLVYQALTDTYIGMDKISRLNHIKDEALENLEDGDYRDLKKYVSDALESRILEVKRSSDFERAMEYVDVLKGFDGKMAESLSGGLYDH